MNYKEELNKIIWTEIWQVSATKIAKAMGLSSPHTIYQRLSWEYKITQAYYKKIIEAYEFIIEAQNTVYKR